MKSVDRVVSNALKAGARAMLLACNGRVTMKGLRSCGYADIDDLCEDMGIYHKYRKVGPDTWEVPDCPDMLNAAAKNAVPIDDSYSPMSYIKGVLKAVKGNPATKAVEGGAWKVVREKPNYKALASTPEYRELDKLMGINSVACNDGVKISEADVKSGKYKEYWIVKTPDAYEPCGFHYFAYEQKPFLHPGSTFVNSVACADGVACNGKFKAGDKKAIREEIIRNYYRLDFTMDGIRPGYRFDASCQGCVPQAQEAFFESENFEDAIRNAISIGGDSDTIGAICGAVAGAYYGVPDDIRAKAMTFLPQHLINVLRDFESVVEIHRAVSRNEKGPNARM